MSSLRSGPQPFRQSPAKSNDAISNASEEVEDKENKKSKKVNQSEVKTVVAAVGEDTPDKGANTSHFRLPLIKGLIFKPASTPKKNKNTQNQKSDQIKPSSNKADESKMSGSTSNVVTSQPQPQNLASASASAATSLLYTGGGGGGVGVSSSGGTNLLSGYSSSGVGVDKNRWDDSNRQKSSSLSGRYSGATSGQGTALTGVSNGSVVGNTNGITSANNGVYSNGSSLTGTGTAGSYSSAKSGNYRLASLDRLAQRQKLYEQSQNGPAGPGMENLQSKRELFFKNETSPAPSLVTSINNANSGPTSLSGVGASNGHATQTKELNSMSGKIDTIRTHHHPNNAGNIEDNRERESKESKMKMEKQEKDKRRKELDGYVGFANLPNQVYRKAVKKGFDFTLMVVGESGLGKSTLINSMFLADIYSAEYPGPSNRVKKTVQVETCKVLMKENGVNLTLTIVDTPGFGDSIDNSQCWQPVLDYIENRYEDYLNAESRVNRKAVLDSRVHSCLYFIAPSGHGMKALDIELMKKLHDKVNIIPVIAKADTLTPEECAHFKKQILNEIAQNKIKIYEFPDCDDEEENKINKMMRERVPFAVVGSNTVLEVDGKKLRGRKYPWGTVIVENLEHCDFVALRNMVVRTHLQDLKDVTNNVHYENFRCRKLAGLGPDGKPVKGFDKNPLAQMEEEKKNHDTKMKKMEIEMEQVFELKVKERTQRLTNSEKDLKRREEQMRTALDKLHYDFDDKKKQFESEKLAWEQASGITFEELRRRNLEALSKEAVKKRKGKDKTRSQLTMELAKMDDGNVTIVQKTNLVPFSVELHPNVIPTSSESPSYTTDNKTSPQSQSPTASSTSPNQSSNSNTLKRSKSVPKRRASFRGQDCTPS